MFNAWIRGSGRHQIAIFALANAQVTCNCSSLLLFRLKLAQFQFTSFLLDKELRFAGRWITANPPGPKLRQLKFDFMPPIFDFLASVLIHCFAGCRFVAVRRGVAAGIDNSR